jgi:hypothetical protein
LQVLLLSWATRAGSVKGNNGSDPAHFSSCIVQALSLVCAPLVRAEGFSRHGGPECFGVQLVSTRSLLWESRTGMGRGLVDGSVDNDYDDAF